MAINPKLLSKSSAPAPGGADPMLSMDDMGLDDEAGTDAEGDAPNELEGYDDDMLIAELEKRGIKVQAPGEEGAAGNGTGMPPVNPFSA